MSTGSGARTAERKRSMSRERRYEVENGRVVLRREEFVPQSQLRRRLEVVQERIADLEAEKQQLEAVIVPPEDGGDDGDRIDDG